MADYFMKQYEKRVDRAFQNQEKSSTITNDSAEHAAILIEKMLKYVKKEIIIRCHCLSRDIYGKDAVIKALKDAYQRNPELKCRVYLRADIPNLTPFLSTLIKHKAEIHTEYEPDDGKEDVIVIDGASGRIEKDHEQRKAKAYINDRTFWAEELQRFSFAC